MNYSLHMPQHVIVGSGSRSELHDIIFQCRAKRILLLTDCGVWNSGSLKDLIESLKSDHVMVINDVPTEPAKGQVLELYFKAREFNVQLVVAIGGGSVMDTAKLIAAMLKNPSFAEDILQPEQISAPSVPTVFMPTTAGTGSEATQNAIVLIEEEKVKQGIIHPNFIPTYVILDAELTLSVPPKVVASTGIDALCHAIETMISKKTNQLCRTFSISAIRLIFDNLRQSYSNPSDIAAHENMLLAAFYGGVGINLSSTVAVHALSYPLGGSYRIPHGISNAMLLVEVMRYNLPACTTEMASMADILEIGTGCSKEVKATLFLDALNKLVQDVAIPTKLTEYHVAHEDIGRLAESAIGVTRLLAQNPREMNREDIQAIYEKLF